MRKETMDLGGVTPLIIREFGDGSVKEFTVQLVKKKSDMLLQAVLRNNQGSSVLNIKKYFNRLYSYSEPSIVECYNVNRRE
jgi:hypothetical protein